MKQMTSAEFGLLNSVYCNDVTSAIEYAKLNPELLNDTHLFPLAASKGHIEIMEFLIAKGADPIEDNYFALECAFEDASIGAINFLLNIEKPLCRRFYERCLILTTVQLRNLNNEIPIRMRIDKSKVLNHFIARRLLRKLINESAQVKGV